jgi:hypothetical protein
VIHSYISQAVTKKDKRIIELIERLSGRDFGFGREKWDHRALAKCLGEKTRCADMNTTREFEVFYSEAIKSGYLVNINDNNNVKW